MCQLLCMLKVAPVECSFMPKQIKGKTVVSHVECSLHVESSLPVECSVPVNRSLHVESSLPVECSVPVDRSLPC